MDVHDGKVARIARSRGGSAIAYSCVMCTLVVSRLTYIYSKQNTNKNRGQLRTSQSDSSKGSSTNIDVFLEKLFVRLGGGGGLGPVHLVFAGKNIGLYLWTGAVRTCS